MSNRSKADDLFDHLVGADQERFRDHASERLSRLEVDHELERCRLLDGYVPRMFATQQPGDGGLSSRRGRGRYSWQPLLRMAERLRDQRGRQDDLIEVGGTRVRPFSVQYLCVVAAYRCDEMLERWRSFFLDSFKFGSTFDEPLGHPKSGCQE